MYWACGFLYLIAGCTPQARHRRVCCKLPLWGVHGGGGEGAHGCAVYARPAVYHGVLCAQRQCNGHQRVQRGVQAEGGRRGGVRERGGV
eukprot:2267675-Rhodomonas_salina.1